MDQSKYKHPEAAMTLSCPTVQISELLRQVSQMVNTLVPLSM
ncbi:hypothetical protein V6Z11_D03G148100 [Gossypium hirsutum]